MTPYIYTALFFFFWTLFWSWPIGYLSDDWDLLNRSILAPFWLPIETHHYSPFVNALFTIAQKSHLGPKLFHILAAAFHALNVFFVGYFARHSFAFTIAGALLAAIFFGFNAGGVEAIAWCCAIGYPATVSCVFLGWYLIENSGNELQEKALGWKLGLLQLIAYAIWDWGIVFMPMMAAWLWLKCGFSIKKSLKTVVSAIVVSATIFFLKSIYGLSPGYGWNQPLLMARHLISLPLVTILPQFSAADYASYFGIGGAIGIWLFLLWGAYRSKEARLWLVLYMLSIGPILLFAYPQSRYAYFSGIFLTWTLFWSIDGKKIAMCTLCFLSIFMGMDRVWQWRDANQSYHDLLEEIAIASRHQEIVIANLPDRYGDKEMIWMPYLWQCGKSSLGKNARAGELIEATHVVQSERDKNQWRYKLQVIHTPELLK